MIDSTVSDVNAAGDIESGAAVAESDVRLTQGYMRDLGSQRRRYTWAFAGLAILSVTAVYSDVLLYSPDSPHLQDALYGYGYNLLASLFVSALISRLVVTLRIREIAARPFTNLTVLGLRPSPSLGRIGIVIPSMPTATSATSVARPTEPDAAEVRALLDVPAAMPVSTQIRKGLANLGAFAHSRRDLFFVADLTRLMGDAGFDPPVIVSDVELMQSLAETKNAGTLRRGFHLIDRSDDTAATHQVTHLVVVGMWSNLLTCALGDSPEVPFTLDDTPERRQLVLQSPDGVSQIALDANVADGPTTLSFLCRLAFRDLTVTVLGGARGLGTARIGDLINERPSSCELLWEAEASDDMWSAIDSPGSGRRGEGFSVLSTFKQSEGRFRDRRLVDLISP